MNGAHVKLAALLIASTFGAVGLAGCFMPVDAQTGVLREIRFWVEPKDWEIAPGVTTPVWAFCAEGDGVEPAHEGDCGVPGPTVRVQKGDRIRLTFENTHSIPHSVHFHGWHEFHPDMNGNALLGSHMLVQPGESQVYEWTAEPAGTFIYHCHFHTPEHMEMGMSGAFIVEDPKEEDKPDKEFVAVLDEWAIDDNVTWHGNMPGYNYFTINGKSFPLTSPWLVDKGDRVRIHLVNGGYETHAFHIHGYTPLSWEGVAGPEHAVPTDVRAIVPGQSVVLEITADREGVWLSHDHVVPRVTAGGGEGSYGAYPRGMLNVLVVGKQWHDALPGVAEQLLAAAQQDQPAGGHGHGGEAPADPGATVAMKGAQYATPTLTVKAGTTVTWVNRDSMPHTVTADDGTFESGMMDGGATWSHTFDAPGTYTYHCLPHSYKDKATGEWKGMVAKVIVQ